MTIEEALAQHPGHWNRGRKVAYLNDGGDLILVSRQPEYGEEITPPGSWISYPAIVMEPGHVKRVTGTDAAKVSAFRDFIGTRQRAAA